jgi:small subunit ribosomal protein S3
MGQKINPKCFRLPINRDWVSKWFVDKKKYSKFIIEDENIRSYINKKFKHAIIPYIFIERAVRKIRLRIFTLRPGIIIGRRGKELEKLRKELFAFTDYDIVIDVREVKNHGLVAQVVSMEVAEQLERRIPFRRVIKRSIQFSIQSGAKGIKIRISGRLGGSEIARVEQQKEGNIPLQTIRSNISYGFSEARTTYGIIGVKCWICKETNKIK